MKLIPAIDLLKGKCVRLVKGNFNQKKEFGNDPVKQAKFWEKEGAEFIHIVDLDAAKTGLPLNDSSIRMISESINIPIQIGGGIRSKERIEQLFSYGIDKVIMGTSAIENKKLVKKLTASFPKKIIIGIDANSLTNFLFSIAEVPIITFSIPYEKSCSILSLDLIPPPICIGILIDSEIILIELSFRGSPVFAASKSTI